MESQRPMMHVRIISVKEALRKMSLAIDSVEKTLEEAVAAKYENGRKNPAGRADREISKTSREWMLIG